MVDADQRLVPAERQTFGEIDADEQRPGQPRPARDGNGVESGHGVMRGRVDRLLDNRADRLDVHPRGDLREDAAVLAVHVDLRRDDVGRGCAWPCSTTAAAVSSQDVSIPRISVISALGCHLHHAQIDDAHECRLSRWRSLCGSSAVMASDGSPCLRPPGRRWCSPARFHCGSRRGLRAVGDEELAARRVRIVGARHAEHALAVILHRIARSPAEWHSPGRRCPCRLGRRTAPRNRSGRGAR